MIITDRISKPLEENQPPEQAGFRKGYSTIDHLHTLKQVIETTLEYNVPLVQEVTRKPLTQQSSHKLNSKALAQAISTLFSTYITTANHTSGFTNKDYEPFRLEKGVRQGDTISPKLFTAFLESVIRKIKWESRLMKHYV